MTSGFMEYGIVPFEIQLHIFASHISQIMIINNSNRSTKRPERFELVNRASNKAFRRDPMESSETCNLTDEKLKLMEQLDGLAPTRLNSGDKFTQISQINLL